MPKINSFQRVSVGYQTVAAGPAVAATFDTSPFLPASFSVFVRVLARQTDSDQNNETGQYWRQACFERSADPVTGVISLTQVGSTRTIGTDNEVIAGWDVTVDASGDNIQINVTGETTVPVTTIKWLIDLDIQVNDESPYSA